MINLILIYSETLIYWYLLGFTFYLSYALQ